MSEKLVIPTLCFHSIRPSPGDDIYATDTGKFAEIIAEIKTKFGTTNLENIHNDLIVPTSREVLVTFDDGYKDSVEYALPILQKYGVNAIFFLLPQQFGTTNEWDHRAKVILQHLSEDEARRLVDAGQTIGSHGLTHQNVVKYDADTLRFDLSTSRKMLEDALQVKINSYAYPYGDFNSTAAKVAEQVYDYSFATNMGDPNWRVRDKNTHIKRLSVRGNQEIPAIMNMIIGYGTYK